MPMIRRGDHDGIDGFVLENFSKIADAFGIVFVAQRFDAAIQGQFIDVANVGNLDTGQRGKSAGEFRAATVHAHETEDDLVASGISRARDGKTLGGEETGASRGGLFKKSSPSGGLHDVDYAKTEIKMEQARSAKGRSVADRNDHSAPKGTTSRGRSGDLQRGKFFSQHRVGFGFEPLLEYAGVDRAKIDGELQITAFGQIGGCKARICAEQSSFDFVSDDKHGGGSAVVGAGIAVRSEEHTSELQS